MSESLLSKINNLKLRRINSRMKELASYKAPAFDAASGEVITGNLGRGEGGRFANIEDIKRASQSNNPLEVFQNSKRRMFQTFHNAFTRDTVLTEDLAKSQQLVADLLQKKNGVWDDEVRDAQRATDSLWELETAYRRSMLTGDTGLSPSGVTLNIEGLNSPKNATGQSVAEIMQAAGKDPAGMAKGIGERVVKDLYNYMSMFNQREELKKLNNDKPEINLTTLPEGEKYRIDEKALAEGKIKIDFAYSADKPDGPTKDDITDAMSDVMMKLDPEIEQYAASFAKLNPDFKIGEDGMLKDVLQQAMASLLDNPQKMATENPDLFKFALSASQGVNLFEEGNGGQAGGTVNPTPQPEPKPEEIDPTKYPGNDVEPGLEQKPGKRPSAKPTPAPAPKPEPEPEPEPVSDATVPLTWDEARNTPAGNSQLPPDQQPPKGFSYAGPVQGPTGPNGVSAINPYAPWRNPQTGEVWVPDKASVDKWLQDERDRRAGKKPAAATNATTATGPTTVSQSPTAGPTPTGTPTANATPGPVTSKPTEATATGSNQSSTATTTATTGPTQPSLQGTPVAKVSFPTTVPKDTNSQLIALNKVGHRNISSNKYDDLTREQQDAYNKTEDLLKEKFDDIWRNKLDQELVRDNSLPWEDVAKGSNLTPEETRIFYWFMLGHS